MKKMMSLLILSLMSASCINLEGNLIVNQVMAAKKKVGFLHLQTKKIEIQPGNYKASLKVNSAKSFTLKLKADKEGESDILIPIKSKNGFSIPTNGNVIIRGSEIAQPFDLSGTIQTKITQSDLIRGTQSCFYDSICYDNGQNQIESFPGYQYVEYHNRFTQRNLSVELLDLDSKNVMALFTGTDTDTVRVYDYMGECR